ncbi:uncharacterized protein PV07_08652 [Cladophialophora immunda]|uniref:Uncharacterized protein n=1 Tax=Cladophialophora immunda TaxID=569365 RepID=A0A0D1ZCN3_9EURO|nr:uncharacterized protein PV07_08652 [Cladophialophora immunda]KIW25486.1 hypothetical protein PV07_08652 [Cladophialophora immunda]
MLAVGVVMVVEKALIAFLKFCTKLPPKLARRSPHIQPNLTVHDRCFGRVPASCATLKGAPSHTRHEHRRSGGGVAELDPSSEQEPDAAQMPPHGCLHEQSPPSLPPRGLLDSTEPFLLFVAGCPQIPPIPKNDELERQVLGKPGASRIILLDNESQFPLKLAGTAARSWART